MLHLPLGALPAHILYVKVAGSIVQQVLIKKVKMIIQNPVVKKSRSRLAG